MGGEHRLAEFELAHRFRESSLYRSPVTACSVELVRRDEEGKWNHTSQFWKQTDANGRFEFQDTYRVGYDIWGDRPPLYSAEPTTYYPGALQAAKATMVHLSPGQSITGLSFNIGPPHTARSFRVEVVWPDGTHPVDNLLQLFTGDDLITNVGLAFGSNPKMRHDGIVMFSGHEERSYRLHARYWIDDLGGQTPQAERRIALSDVVEVKPGRGPATVRLTLTRGLLADDER